MNRHEFFLIGKYVGIGIAIVVLVITFLVFYRAGKIFDAITGTLTAAFTVIVYKAAYFQTEVLYYGLMLLLFALVISLLKKPRVLTAFFVGFAAAITHLTKASVLPIVGLAILCLVFKLIFDLLINGRDRIQKAQSPERNNSSYVEIILSIFVSGGTFLIILYPY